MRIADIYSFTEEQKQSIKSVDQKLEFIIKKLEVKYTSLVEHFVEQLKKKNKEMNYQPKVVIDD